MSDAHSTTPASTGASNSSRFRRALKDAFEAQGITFVVGSIFAILAIFPSYFTDQIKSGFNRANAREDRYNLIAKQLSSYIFDCDQVVELLSKGLTTESVLSDAEKEYNAEITDIRKDEYVNRAVLAKYWNSERRDEFDEVMENILLIDARFHDLNDEFAAIVNHTKKSIDPDRANKTAAQVNALLPKLKTQVDNFLNNLQ